MWKPITKIKEVILDILCYFFTCNPDAAYEYESRKLFLTNKELFNKRVKYFTKKYADPSTPYKEYDSWDFSVPKELK